jgi:hypothetical protein
LPDTETWKFINTFAPWLSAVGTLSAVATSLWLAQRDRRIRLAVRASLRIQLLRGGGPGHGDRFLSVNVVNRGRRAATISGIGWRFGLPRRHEFLADHQGTTLPAKLEDGDEAEFLFPLDQFATGFLNAFPKRSLIPLPALRLATMEAIVVTTGGKTFYATITPDLRRELVTRAKNKWARRQPNAPMQRPRRELP